MEELYYSSREMSSIMRVYFIWISYESKKYGGGCFLIALYKTIG